MRKEPLLTLAFLALSLLLPQLAAKPAYAQTGNEALPVRLNADSIENDQQRNLVIAIGNVEVMQGERILLADRISLDRATNRVIAEGHVTMLEPTGDVIFAEYVELTDEMREGVLRQLRVRLTDDSRMAARDARRSGGYRTEMNKAVFSPCKPCKEDPSRPPLWQIKANRIIHDQNTHNIEYKDAFMEMFGVPVLYTPYFSHPDPTVKRRSGFLAPHFGVRKSIGVMTGIPYYWSINPHQDLTIDPIYTSQQGPVLKGEYRQRFTTGEMSLEGSITEGDRDAGGYTKRDQLRGHIKSDGLFHIDPTWRAGYNLYRVTDETYMSRYGFSHDNILKNRLFVDGFRGRSYAKIDNYYFQDLRANVKGSDSPYVSPLLEYNFVSKPTKRGSYLTLDTSFMNLARTNSTDSRRLSTDAGWHLPVISRHGHVFNFDSSLRGDLYSVSDVNVPGRTATKSGTTGRFYPQASLNWSYPLARRTGQTNQLIEPMASLRAAPNGGNPAMIPNEDSLGFDFDTADLFTSNRFPGLDRVEGGHRFDYGFKTGSYGASGSSITALLGQSYRFNPDDTFEQRSGVEDHFSDYVGEILIDPLKYFRLAYQLRVDKDDLAFNRNEIGMMAGAPIFNVNANYTFLEADNVTQTRDEIAFAARSQFTEFWSVGGRGNYDLNEDGGLLYLGFDVTYQDECFGLATELLRTYTRNRDVEPQDSIMVRLNMKYLGTYGGSHRLTSGSKSSEEPIPSTSPSY